MKGLTKQEVEERIKNGQVNYNDTPKTKSISQIIKDNCFTYFNYLNLALGLMVFIASLLNGSALNGLKNCLFMGVIITNTVISIVEEIISKRIIDKLSVVSESKVKVLRDSKLEELSLEEIVLDDVIKLSLGHQIVSDSIIIDGEVEVNESLITGESDSIKKVKGDKLLSGSFIVSGNAYAKVIHVGKDNYVSKITNEAKYKKIVSSAVMDSFVKMLKIISILIIPIGIIMFIHQYAITDNINESIFTTVASLIGMIPEGLVLLTSSVMAVGVIKLYKVNVLVQELYAIEILARVDSICLDKTGTLTEGKMKYSGIIETDKYNKKEIEKYLKEYVLASHDTNQTMMALKDYFKGKEIKCNNKIDFSSVRKYSCIEFDDYTLYMGAPNIIFNKVDEKINDYIEDYRIIGLGIKKGKLDEKLKNIEEIGYILIEDVIRPSAKDTLNYFKENNVLVKIISGDNIKTVMSIAKKVGLNDIKGIDIGDLSNEELEDVIDKYDIFGRAKPEQKKIIVKHLKANGHTVAMTGDGVNDVLSLKESDCAISVKSGTDAARNVSQLILLNDDFNSLPKVVKEGRQIVNNIERSASLLLVKTLYTMMLILFSIFTLQKYFFIPIQLTFITSFTIGIPSFILALEPNNKLIKGNFLFKIVSRSLPVALTVLFNVFLVWLIANNHHYSYELRSTISVLLTTITGLYYLFKICYPFNLYRGSLFGVMTSGFILCVIFFHSFFNILPVDKPMLLLIVLLSAISFVFYEIINYIVTLVFHKFDNTIELNSLIFSHKER
jgi:cation-transporting ATPase E